MQQIRRRSHENELSAALTGARSQVDNAIGSEHDLSVVLDHDERVACIPQAPQHTDDALQIACVQADAGFIEYEQRVDQRCAEGRSEIDALHLAAAQGARLAVKREITEPDFHQVMQPRTDLVDQQLGGLV